MSYDITTEPDTGLDWNYTYNVQPMTAKAGLRSLTELDGRSWWDTGERGREESEGARGD